MDTTTTTDRLVVGRADPLDECLPIDPDFGPEALLEHIRQRGFKVWLSVNFERGLPPAIRGEIKRHHDGLVALLAAGFLGPWSRGVRR